MLAIGTENNELCGRGGCMGVLTLEAQISSDNGCTCFLTAPCWWCLSHCLACDVCGATPEDDPENC